jgi:hypothetical protein
MTVLKGLAVALPVLVVAWTVVVRLHPGDLNRRTAAAWRGIHEEYPHLVVQLTRLEKRSSTA